MVMKRPEKDLVIDLLQSAINDVKRLQTEGDTETAKLKNEVEALHKERTGEVWYWQGDSEDHLESLTCPILIEPEDLKTLLGEREREVLTLYAWWKNGIQYVGSGAYTLKEALKERGIL